ncbi:MAG: methyltransferase domain-containing protein [Pseudomonadota bacterium]
MALSPDTRILVAIANHGTKNRRFLDHLLAVYRSFPAKVDIVVLSDQPKDLGPDIEVRVGAPIANPWSLPFGHKKLFVERAGDYDLFIYSEDDTEITEAHVDAFLKATVDLPDDKIAGFLRHEIGPDGTRYCSTIHGPYYWDPASVMEAGGQTFARYTNDHSASYILTAAQLERCIASGGFDVPPHEGLYDMLCSAATDPYVRCGLTKLVCVSDLDAFSLRHLPDIYLGRIGMVQAELDILLGRLLEMPRSEIAGERLLETHTGLGTILLDKNHDEPLRPEVLTALEAKPGTVLSVGCEAGATEGALVAAGIPVTSVPIDKVISALAEAKGVLPTNDAAGKGDSYDYLLFNNVVHYADDPENFMRSYLHLLKPGGRILITYTNGSAISFRRRLGRLFGRPAMLSPRKYLMAGHYHYADNRVVKQWLRAVDAVPEKTLFHVPARHAARSKQAQGLADKFLAEAATIIATVR